MRLRKKPAAIVLAVLALVIFAIYLWRSDAKNEHELSIENPHLSESETADDLSGNATPSDHAIQKTGIAQSSYVLPSIDKPIDEAFGELKQAADIGEAKASCRLGIEVVKCQLLLQQDEKQINEMADNFHAHTWPENQNFADEAAIATLKGYKACKNLSKEQLKAAEALLEQAAKQKQLDAMVVWASGIWIEARYGNTNGYLQDPAFDRWRVSAVPVMNEALQRGSFDAAAEFWMSYKYDHGHLFRSLVKNDDRQAHAFFILTGLILNKPRQPSGNLSATDLLEAEAKGKKMFQEWFGSRTSNEEELTSPLFSIPTGGEDQHDFCNSPVP